MILNPKTVQNKIKNEILNELNNIEDSPTLSIIRVGDDFGSISYEKSIYNILEPLGFNIKTLELDKSISQEDLLECINKLNNDSSVSGILVLKPLPNQIDEKVINEFVNPLKDVDGTNPVNLGKLLINDPSGLNPCTPEAVIELLDFYNIDTVGKNTVIINRSNLLGKPLSLMLTNKDSTVILCNSKTQDLDSLIKKADILISATGISGFITPDRINDKSTIIDVTVTPLRDKQGKIVKNEDGKIIMSGDVSEECKDKAKNIISITPNCGGGIGPLTTTILARNVLKSYKQGKKIGNN